MEHVVGRRVLCAFGETKFQGVFCCRKFGQSDSTNRVVRGPVCERQDQFVGHFQRTRIPRICGCEPHSRQRLEFILRWVTCVEGQEPVLAIKIKIIGVSMFILTSYALSSPMTVEGVVYPRSVLTTLSCGEKPMSVVFEIRSLGHAE